jgi:hypothetical protein
MNARNVGVLLTAQAACAFCGIEMRIRSKSSPSERSFQFELNSPPVSPAPFRRRTDPAMTARAVLRVKLLAAFGLLLRVHAIPLRFGLLRRDVPRAVDVPNAIIPVIARTAT